MQKLRICTHNIAGGYVIDSDSKVDLAYVRQDVPALARLIGSGSPDVVCVQETLLTPDYKRETSVAWQLAGELGMDHVWQISAQHVANHIDPTKQLGMAIISKLPIAQHFAPLFYPDPAFPLKWADGCPALVHHRFLLAVEVGGLVIATTHLLPLEFWGYSYSQGAGKKYTAQLEEVLMAAPELKPPFVLCGDLNMINPEILFGNFFAKYDLRDAVPPGLSTEIKGRTIDHMLYSRGVKLVGPMFVNQTRMFDHSPVFAGFEW